MCFSATASFTASAVITSIGVAGLRSAKSSEERPFAVIPVFFGIQQFCEGLIWLSFDHVEFAGIQNMATLSFLAFAWVVWPALVPYAAYKMETNENRKKWLHSIFYLGAISSLYSVYRMFIGEPIPYLSDFHIDYRFVRYNEGSLLDIPQQLSYLIATVVPFFISTRRGANLLAFCNFISLLIAYYFFRHALPSTWCFFAAIISGLIVWILNLKSAEHKREMMISSH